FAPAAVTAFRLLLYTGARLSEIQTLKWEHIRGNRIHLPDSKTGAKTIPLNGPALEVLANTERVEGNPHVIVGTGEGAHLTDLQKPWRRVRKAAGLEDVRIHDLRHTFASEAVMRGESLPMVGRILGHTQAQTTSRYAHLADDPLRKASERVASSLRLAMHRQGGS
ncbi:MAG: site-specific integrase, partial [Rhodospirillales bacterium]|nr:site-specific integrase [Rhodospirillales bacterium]